MAAQEAAVVVLFGGDGGELYGVAEALLEIHDLWRPCHIGVPFFLKVLNVVVPFRQQTLDVWLRQSVPA